MIFWQKKGLALRIVLQGAGEGGDDIACCIGEDGDEVGLYSIVIIADDVGCLPGAGKVFVACSGFNGETLCISFLLFV